MPFLAVRGISDVVGIRRHPDWIAYACETAAAFAKAFLLTRPIEPIPAAGSAIGGGVGWIGGAAGNAWHQLRGN